MQRKCPNCGSYKTMSDRMLVGVTGVSLFIVGIILGFLVFPLILLPVGILFMAISVFMKTKQGHCRVCHHKFPIDLAAESKTVDKKQKRSTLRGAIVLGVFILAIMVMFASALSKVKPDPKITAIVCAEQIVTQRLKSPSTAEFPSASHYTFIGIGENKYRLGSYVDAENSFGAKLRTQFTCDVTIPDLQKGNCDVDCHFL